MRVNKVTVLLLVVAATVLACGARSDLDVSGSSSGSMEEVREIVVPAASGPPAGEYFTTMGATPTGITLHPGDQIDFLSATGLATYGSDGTACGPMPQTDPSGMTRYENGMPVCPGKVDSSSVDHGYIGALLFGVDCGGQGSVAGWAPVWGSAYLMTLSVYQGCTGQLFLLYNDDPGQYGNNAGDYTATIESIPAGP
jgi:hypothetical protein